MLGISLDAGYQSEVLSINSEGFHGESIDVGVLKSQHHQPSVKTALLRSPNGHFDLHTVH